MLKMSTYLKAICFASVKRWALSNICFLCPPGAETWTPRWYHRQTDRRISKISKTFHVHFFPLSPKFEWNVKNTMTVCLKLSPGRSEGTLFPKSFSFLFQTLINLFICQFHSIKKNIFFCLFWTLIDLFICPASGASSAVIPSSDRSRGSAGFPGFPKLGNILKIGNRTKLYWESTINVAFIKNIDST